MEKNLISTTECDDAFQKIKQYLGGISVLAKPRIGKDLTLYLSISEHTVSSVIVQDEGTVWTPIYFVNKALQDAETRYLEIEKLAIALVVVARIFRPYFQSHIIWVPTNYPLRQVLQNPNVFGRLTKWAIKIREFDIEFMPRTAIKRQTLADFVAEFTYSTTTLSGPIDKLSASGEHKKNDELTDLSNVWSLRIYGSSIMNRSDASVVLDSPTGEKISYALRLKFPASNNEAKYEALLAEL